MQGSDERKESVEGYLGDWDAIAVHHHELDGDFGEDFYRYNRLRQEHVIWLTMIAAPPCPRLTIHQR